MSYRSKVTVLSALVVLLLIGYFVGGRWYLKGSEEAQGRRLFEAELLDSVDEVVLRASGAAPAETRLFKAKGSWQLSAAVDSSRIPASTEAVASLFDTLKNYEIFVRVDSGAEEWSAYSRDYEGSLVMRENSRNTELRTRTLRIGDEVAGSARRYVRSSDESIYEGQDISNLLSRDHSHWADLSLFSDGLSYDSVAAVEFRRAEEGEGASFAVRLERSEDGSGEGIWNGSVIGGSGEVVLDEEMVRSTLRSLFRVEGLVYLGDANSGELAEQFGRTLIAVAVETGRGTRERCLFLERTAAGAADAAGAEGGNGSPGGRGGGYLVRYEGRIYTVPEQMLIGLTSGLDDIETALSE